MLFRDWELLRERNDKDFHKGSNSKELKSQEVVFLFKKRCRMEPDLKELEMIGSRRQRKTPGLNIKKLNKIVIRFFTTLCLRKNRKQGEGVN